MNITYTPKINKIKIDQKYISVFASGNSILDINDRHLKALFEKTFIFTMNYGFEYFIGKGFNPNINIHSDIRVTEYIQKWLQSNKKSFKILSRKEAFNGQTIKYMDMVDYHFLTNEFGRGHYTIFWLLSILVNYYPNKTILLFGFDKEIKNNQQKFYDTYTNYDKNKRGSNYNTISKLVQCEKQLQKLKDKKIINCNIDSNSDVFEKIKTQNIIDKILGEDKPE